MPNVYDVLEIANQQTGIVQVLPGHWVRFQSTTGGSTYTSANPTAANGSFQLSNVAADTYKVFYGSTPDGPWIDTGWQYLVLANLGIAGVDLSTNQTIAGIKTFTSRPVVPGDYVDVSGSQTITGLKTFTSLPVFPGGGFVDLTNPQNIAGVKTFTNRPNLPNDYVDLGNNQTIGGTKTFTTRPVWPTDNYHAEVYATGVTNLTQNAFTKILMAGEEADPNGNYSIATSTYTCPIPGRYHIMSAIEVSGGGAGSNVILSVFRNGTEARGSYHNAGDTGPLSTVVRCTNAGDTLDIRYFTNVAGVSTSAVQSRTYAQYAYVGPL